MLLVRADALPGNDRVGRGTAARRRSSRNYLRETAAAFHAFYNAEPILTADEELRNARLGLCKATQQVLANGLALLGVSAPETM